MTTIFSDGQGRLLLSGVERPGRMHDQTAVRSEGIAEQFRQHPSLKAQVEGGTYQVNPKLVASRMLDHVS